MNKAGVISKAESFLWKFLLILICLRPFISEYVFLTVGSWYIFLLISSSLIFLAFVGKRVLCPLRLNLWPLLFTIAILVSLLLSGRTQGSLNELYFFIPNILIFYIASKIRHEQQRQLLACVFFTAGIICLYAVYQYFIGLRHTFEYLSPAQQSSFVGKFLSSRRVFATFISPNIFASYIVMMLFVSIGLLRSSRGKERLIYWVGIIAMALSLVYTKSFGGFLTFLIAFFLFMPHLSSLFRFARANKLWFGFILIIIVCAIILICKLFFYSRLSQVFNLNNPDNSIVQRFYYWKTSINMIKESPFTGVGWRKFEVLYEFYKPLGANTSHYAHNAFLQILVETGPLGLVSFLLIVVTFLRNGLMVIRNSVGHTALKAGLFYAGCAFLMHNIIDLSFYFGQAAFFWWMLAGLFSNFRAEKT